MILLKKRWSKKVFNNMIKNMTFHGNNVTFYLFYDLYFLTHSHHIYTIMYQCIFDQFQIYLLCSKNKHLMF